MPKTDALDLVESQQGEDGNSESNASLGVEVDEGALSGIARLNAIRRHLAQELQSQGSVAENETLCYPGRGSNSDCNEQNTISVDSFLFDEDDVDSLVDSGQLPSHFCRDCGSKNVASLSMFTLYWHCDLILAEYH